jgi:hypothetical protein
MSRRRKRDSPEQIVRLLRDADAMLASGKTIGEVCQALSLFSNLDSRMYHLAFSIQRSAFRNEDRIIPAGDRVSAVPSGLVRELG